ncbi:hypothetical protein [Streptomyces sp. NPDC046909]|uniref:hypothetical protein n=1 Tax=Streptomyces sp. NPDC046909 TaxID=3155617 RepID=UPI0033FD9DB9
MAVLQRRRVNQVVTEAVFAHDRGDPTFEAAIDMDPRARVPAPGLRGAVAELIAAVEAVGWKCTAVESFASSVEMAFLRL